jgi:hypothetical protein
MSHVDHLGLSGWQKLYGQGARRINIAGAPPIGCVPSQRTNAGGLERECVSLYNQASVVYNAALEKEIKRLNGSEALPGSVLKYIDLYTPLLDMIQRPDAYGDLFTRKHMHTNPAPNRVFSPENHATFNLSVWLSPCCRIRRDEPGVLRHGSVRGDADVQPVHGGTLRRPQQVPLLGHLPPHGERLQPPHGADH